MLRVKPACLRVHEQVPASHAPAWLGLPALQPVKLSLLWKDSACTQQLFEQDFCSCQGVGLQLEAGSLQDPPVAILAYLSPPTRFALRARCWRCCCSARPSRAELSEQCVHGCSEGQKPAVETRRAVAVLDKAFADGAPASPALLWQGLTASQPAQRGQPLSAQSSEERSGSATASQEQGTQLLL